MARLPDVPTSLMGIGDTHLKTYLLAVAASTIHGNDEAKLKAAKKWYDWIANNS